MVLYLAEHGSAKRIRPLNAGDDQALRRVFGRYGDPQAEQISRASALLLSLRGEAAGRCWLICDCVPRAEDLAPIMTVTGARILRPHIRRIEGKGRGLHSLDCDFATADDEQGQRLVTFQRRPLVDGRRLLRVVPKGLLSKPLEAQEPRTSGPRRDRISRGKARPPLGRLLAELMTEAGLQRMAHDENVLELGEQYRRLRVASESVHLAPGIRLRDYFHTHFPSISGFQNRITRANPDEFFPAPPHGIFLGVADALEDYSILIHGGGRIVIPGQLTTHDESQTENAQGEGAGPFLAVVLFASLSKEFAQPVSAYLQPVLSPKRLMLLANSAERHGLQQIRKLQKGIIHSGVQIDIQKPLFFEDFLEDFGGEDVALPSFVIHRIAPFPTRFFQIVSDGFSRRFNEFRLRYEIDLNDAEAQDQRDAAMRRDLRRALLER